MGPPSPKSVEYTCHPASIVAWNVISTSSVDIVFSSVLNLTGSCICACMASAVNRHRRSVDKFLFIVCQNINARCVKNVINRIYVLSVVNLVQFWLIRNPRTLCFLLHWSAVVRLLHGQGEWRNFSHLPVYQIHCKGQCSRILGD